MSKDDKALAVLASRLAESVLMDWDKEEQVRLAKDVACECHKNQVFVSLVGKMREAQEREAMLSGEEDDEFLAMVCVEARRAERKIDEYLKKMEDEE